MTNSEAIEYGKEQLEIFGGQHAEFIRMAIEALSNSQKQSESLIRTSADSVSEADVIYRQDAIDATWEEPTYTDPINVLTEVRDRIKALPSAQRTGEWIRWYEEIENDTCTEYIPHCKCSECGTEYDPHTVKFINFCTYCGADMRNNGDD